MKGEQLRSRKKPATSHHTYLWPAIEVARLRVSAIAPQAELAKVRAFCEGRFLVPGGGGYFPAGSIALTTGKSGIQVASNQKLA
jgi:hypothetical protein